MYGRWAINQDAGPQEAASIAATLNTQENLRSIIQSPEAIMRQTMTDSTEIVLLHPTGPYTDRALMLGAYIIMKESNLSMGTEAFVQLTGYMIIPMKRRRYIGAWLLPD